METGTFLQENIQEFINKFYIPLKYESGGDAEQFLRFAVKATPTFIFLNSEGDEVDRVIGYYNPGDFMKLLENARKKSN